MIDMAQNLLTDIIEEKCIINRRMAHGIVSTIVASMEAKFLYLAILWITQSDFLALHLNDIFGLLVDLLIVEGTDSHCNLNCVCHLINIT